MRDHDALHALARSHALTHREQAALTRLLAAAEAGGVLDGEGAGTCAACGLRVIGEPSTLLTYWHPVEVCRDRLASRLRYATKLLAFHGLTYAPDEVPA